MKNPAVRPESRSTSTQRRSCPAVSRGDVLDILGTVATDSNGEQVIEDPYVELIDSASEPKPLGLVNRSVGGGSLGYQSGVTLNKVAEHGVNNIGLLIRVWGKVQSTGTGLSGPYFTIDDGSGVSLRCYCSATPSGSYALVTGISSCEYSGTNLIPVVRTRNASDMTSF